MGLKGSQKVSVRDGINIFGRIKGKQTRMILHISQTPKFKEAI